MGISLLLAASIPALDTAHRGAEAKRYSVSLNGAQVLFVPRWGLRDMVWGSLALRGEGGDTTNLHTVIRMRRRSHVQPKRLPEGYHPPVRLQDELSGP